MLADVACKNVFHRPFISLRHCCVERKTGRIRLVKYWEIIADDLKKRGWSYGYVSVVDSQGRTIWIADAHRDDGKRFVVRADQKLLAANSPEKLARFVRNSRI